MQDSIKLFHCPRKKKIPLHSQEKTVWFNSKMNIFECLDLKCNGRFTMEELRGSNVLPKLAKKGEDIRLINRHKLGFHHSVRKCPICGSNSIFAYGGDYPRYKCEKGHIFA